LENIWEYWQTGFLTRPGQLMYTFLYIRPPIYFRLFSYFWHISLGKYIGILTDRFSDTSGSTDVTYFAWKIYGNTNRHLQVFWHVRVDWWILTDRFSADYTCIYIYHTQTYKLLHIHVRKTINISLAKVQINNFCWEYICWLLPIKLFQCKLDCQIVLILHNMFIFELVCQNFQWMLLLVSASFITACLINGTVDTCHLGTVDILKSF
jgi:hypothetical protein